MRGNSEGKSAEAWRFREERETTDMARLHGSLKFAAKRLGGGSAKLLRYLVDLIGIEPMTSSMPWNCRKRKLLTAKWLEVGKTGKTGEIAPL